MTAESGEHKGRLQRYLEVLVGAAGPGRSATASSRPAPNGSPPTTGLAIEALQRYMLYFGPGKADSLLEMLDDLADLFEQSAASGTPSPRGRRRTTRWSSPRSSSGTTRKASGSAGSGPA